MKAVFKNANVLKNTTEMIKDVVSTASFDVFETGISIYAMDASHSSLVKFNLLEDVFTDFVCTTPVEFGIHLETFYKILKVANNKDILSIEYNSNDLSLHVSIVNNETNVKWSFQLKTMDIDCEKMSVPSIPAGWQIFLSHTELGNNLKTLCDFGDSIEIVCSTDNCITFETTSDIKNVHVVVPANCKWVQNNSFSIIGENVRNTFSSKFLKLYGDGRKFSDKIKFHLCQDFPLFIEYQIADKSTLTVIIAPYAKT